MIRKNTPDSAKAVDAAVDGRIMHSEARFESILLTLAPGESMPSHTNPFDVLFIGISGQANLLANEGTFSISSGETIFVTHDEMRAWENHRQTPCRIMVVKILSNLPPDPDF